MTRKVIGTYIFNYVTHKAVLKSTKICSIIFLWGTLIISMLLIEHWHIRIFLILVGIGVSVHLLMLKTIEKAELLPADKQYRPEEAGF